MQKSKAYAEELVADVRKDFAFRSAQRRSFEAQWQLNTNFVLGNQYCFAHTDGTVGTGERDYFWQEREVFNHVAPIVETRLAKLGRVRPKMSVRPASGDETDILTSKASGKILASACRKVDLEAKISQASMWSELTGSVFYKVSWDKTAGCSVGLIEEESVFEGDVRIDICPPYEIYPDRLTHQDVASCNSILHAKAVPVGQIMRIWGKAVAPDESDLMSMQAVSAVGGLGQTSAVAMLDRKKSDGYALVLERYTRPSPEKPEGEWVIVAGNELLHHGTLPYINEADGKRGLPFIKQDALLHAGCFYGMSMVERVIPIQRAFNAVKNRKHEFMNRISMGVLAVEDGSVDTENLETEGLSPGKILVYRQGSTPPRLLEPGSVPLDFTREEDRLLSEFVTVSGVSEIMRSSSVPTGISSGTALSLLLEQDDTRLSVTAEHVRSAIRGVAVQMLRLYKQFATQVRLSRFVGDEGDVELLRWNASDIGCDDVIFDTENELSSTPATKQNMMFELLRMGLLQDENGKLSDAMRYKILDVVGYGGWELTRDVSAMQVNNAQRENERAPKQVAQVSEIDDHALHVAEHTKFVLSAEFGKLTQKKPEIRAQMLEHIRAHKTLIQGGDAVEKTE